MTDNTPVRADGMCHDEALAAIDKNLIARWNNSKSMHAKHDEIERLKKEIEKHREVELSLVDQGHELNRAHRRAYEHTLVNENAE